MGNEEERRNERRREIEMKERNRSQLENKQRATKHTTDCLMLMMVEK